MRSNFKFIEGDRELCERAKVSDHVSIIELKTKIKL